MPIQDRNGQAQCILEVDLSRAAQQVLAFIFDSKVMPFGVVNARALFQQLMRRILNILRRRPLVQELVSRGGETEAHIGPCELGD